MGHWAHGHASSHWEMLHSGGGAKHSYLNIIWDLDHLFKKKKLAFFHWIPRGKTEPSTSSLDLQRKTTPIYRTTASTKPYLSLQENCSHHLIRLLPTPWLTGCQVVFWLTVSVGFFVLLHFILIFLLSCGLFDFFLYLHILIKNCYPYSYIFAWEPP